MSVQQIDIEVLNTIGSRLVTIGHRKTCDEWYSYSCSQILTHGDIWKNATKIIKNLADMNGLNYSKRYKDEPYESLSEFVEIGISEISVYQFLKYIQYAMYNTFDYEECFNAEQKKVANFFRLLEHDILSNIVKTLPEYENAKWG